MVELLNHIARLWWAWTASMFWQVGLLILLIGCIDLLIHKWAWPQLRYALWSLILVKLILPPSLSLPSSIVPELRPRVAQALRWMNSERPAANNSPVAISLYEDMFTAPAAEPSSAVRFSVLGGIVKIEDLGDGSSVARPSWPCSSLLDTRAERPRHEEDHPQASLEAATRPITPALDPGPQLQRRVYAMMIWLLGTLILGIWLFLRLHSVAGRHAYQAAAASLPRSFYNHLADCAMRLGLRRIPRVAVTKRLTSPAVFGVFRPVLLVPKGYLSKLSRRDTEHMLLHELAHIKRGDLAMHGLYMLLQIVYWYNPLLWLVRQQVHHLRELSCDGTVAELLRERTLAYRQTLLETARRLLATSAEPGLGLLGLFEDSNRLLVRLNWLTKPTWRYRTMKRVTVATIAALMFACVLPMAQARESASKEQTPTVVREENQQSQDQVSQDLAALQTRLEQLMAQQQELQNQLRALAAQRNQIAGQEQPTRSRRPEAAAGPRRERAPAESPAAPVPPAPPATPTAAAPPAAQEYAGHESEEQVRDVHKQVQRAQEEAKWAMKDAQKAQQAAKARAQEQQDRAKQIHVWAEQLHQWEQSEEMRKWQEDMKKWGEQMGRWGQEFGRRQMEAMGQSADDSEVPEMAPMPAMPAMPTAPAVEGMNAPMQPVPHPMPQLRAPGGGAPRPPVPEIALPRIVLPQIDMPVVEPPVPPHVPAKEENQEEAVSWTEHTIDLAAGRLLEVKNEMGWIIVHGSDEPGGKLVVTVKGRAPTMEEARRLIEQVKPVIKPSQNGVYVTTTKPENEDRKDHVICVVTMEIVVPRDARIRLDQAFGDIQLAGLQGSVDAFSQMGSIRATDVSGKVALKTNFGEIDFVAPKGLSAKVQARSQMGSIRSDLPLEVVKPGGFSMGSKASGTIGGGEGDVSLTTNMGSIRIRPESFEPARLERSRREPRPEPRPDGEF